MEKILNRIRLEREYQKGKYSTGFDDNNSANDWVSYVNRYVSKAGSALPSDMPIDVEGFEEAMIEGATLCIAAIEALERAREENFELA